MKRFLRLLLALFGPQPPPPPPPPPPSPPPGSDPWTEEMLQEANSRRAAAGKPPLAASDVLMARAGAWAVQMAAQNRMSHDGFAARAKGFRSAAENVAAGQRSAAEVVDRWMSSPGHRANLLGPYSVAGAGVARSASGFPYFCMIFAA